MRGLVVTIPTDGSGLPAWAAIGFALIALGLLAFIAWAILQGRR